ncbi:MAG: deoxyribose-phosphate aldolase [Wenzhouxiangella sp.]|jgi:deoxyribose-phosphate aldolase|nr:deoxyribose-phosphate aldolase [Wenzhouxiangella sp.]
MSANLSGQTDIARGMIGLVDLTRLESTDTGDDSERRAIAELCRRAATPAGPVAAVCVYPAWVELADRSLREAGVRESVRLATVANFPGGTASVDDTVAEIRAALDQGADEIDVVLPWRALRDGHVDTARRLLAASRIACAAHCMKVILESGELAEPELIRQASKIAIACGADFLKTSTGKVPVNATLSAATIMLETVRDSGRDVGFKASGGLRRLEDAAAYLALAGQMMGSDWIGPDHLRFGASSLLDDLLAHAAASGVA